MAIYRVPTSAQYVIPYAMGGTLPPKRMRGVYSGTEYFWWSWDGTPDTTGRWWPQTGGVAFSSLTNVMVVG